MTVDVAAPVAAAWDLLQRQLRRLEDSGYRVPCLDLADLFVSDNQRDRATAVPWCIGCPARTPCHTYAETAQEPVYVWGGVDRAPRFRGGNKTEETQ